LNEIIKEIVEMGFERDVVLVALEYAENDKELAIDYLINVTVLLYFSNINREYLSLNTAISRRFSSSMKI